MEAALRKSENSEPPAKGGGEVEWVKMTEVRKLVKLSPATIYGLINKGRFPPPIKLGIQSFWLVPDIVAWKQEVIDRSRREGWKNKWLDVRLRKKKDGAGK